MKLYVGNLSYGVGDDQLKALFEAHGPVVNAKVIVDRESGRSRGFGFVELQSEDAGKNAIATMHGQVRDGRPLVVTEARPKEARPEGGRRPIGGGGFRTGGGPPRREIGDSRARGYGSGGGGRGYGGGGFPESPPPPSEGRPRGREARRLNKKKDHEDE